MGGVNYRFFKNMFDAEIKPDIKEGNIDHKVYSTYLEFYKYILY